MRTYDVQGVEIATAYATLFEYVSNPRNLPRWAHAFEYADAERARLATPAGRVEIGLRTDSNVSAGTVDWRLEFPDGTVGVAQSRVTETTRGTCIYSFVLHAPPVPLEEIEGALEAQSATLRKELATLKELLER